MRERERGEEEKRWRAKMKLTSLFLSLHFLVLKKIHSILYYFCFSNYQVVLEVVENYAFSNRRLFFFCCWKIVGFFFFFFFVCFFWCYCYNPLISLRSKIGIKKNFLFSFFLLLVMFIRGKTNSFFFLILEIITIRWDDFSWFECPIFE